MKDQTRNLNPTAEAIVAMCIWSKEYSEQKGGSMDFYDSLSIPKRKQCISVVHDIQDALARTKS
jgi:hypothetical protein